MREITPGKITELLSGEGLPSISLFLNKEAPAGCSASPKSRLRDLITEAGHSLGLTYGPILRDRLLFGLNNALDSLRMPRFFGSLAIFHNEEFSGFMRLRHPLNDLSVAADSFHLKPLLRDYQMNGEYYILAFRKRCADFYLVTPARIRKFSASNTLTAFYGRLSKRDF